MSKLYEALSAKFPTEAHKSKQGKFTYVPAEDYISRLNTHLDLSWSWEITSQHVDLTSATSAVVVCGVLTYTTEDGSTHRKAGTGAHQDATGKVEIDMLAKTANTEALKNAAKLIGVCLYLYDEDDRKEVEQEMRQPKRPAKPATQPQTPADMAFAAALATAKKIAPKDTPAGDVTRALSALVNKKAESATGTLEETIAYVGDAIKAKPELLLDRLAKVAANA